MKIFTWILLTITMINTVDASNSVSNTVTVEGPFVTLGDIFPGTPEKLAGTQVLISPQPGQVLNLNQQWLTTVAAKYGLVYTPQTKNDALKVVTASDAVPMEEVEQALKDHLTQIIKNEAFLVKLDNNELRLHFPKGKVGDIMVTNADVSPQQNRFTATVVLNHEGRELNRTKVMGRIVTMTSVPVLTRVIHKGHAIQAEDIEWQNIPSAQVNHATIMEESEMVGAMSKRQDLQPNRPLTKNDISIPNMVNRNQSVTIYAESPNITVTAKGKAMENGAKDAYVKIMNVDSQKIIHATVIGPQQVRVDIPMAYTVTSTE